MKSLVHSLLMACVALLWCVPCAQADAERDGKDWQTRGDAWKYAYMTGILDGVTTGSDFTLPTLSKGSITLYKPDKACLEKAESTYNYNTSRFFFGLSLKDFVEGLDSFYQEPANRVIPVNRALRVWAMQRKNIPEASELLQQLRAEWAAPN